MKTRRRLERGWVVASLLIGTLMPTETSAQSAVEALGEPRPQPIPAIDADHALVNAQEPEHFEAEHFELSFGLAPTLGGLAGLAGIGGLGGLGGLQGMIGLPVAMDLGVPLGSRALLSIGGAGTYAESGTSASFAVQLPISVLVYLDRPRAGAFVPIVRVQLRGSYAELRSDLASSAMLALGAGARGGLTYLFDDAVAKRAGLAAGLDGAMREVHTSVGLRLESSFTLVLRT